MIESKNIGKNFINKETEEEGRLISICHNPSFTMELINGERISAAIDSPIGRPWEVTDEPINTDPKVKLSALGEAENLIYSERAKQYGDFGNNMKIVSGLFQYLTGNQLTEEECCQFLICLKLARESTKHKRDNLIDIAGYVGLWDDLRRRI